jgi:tetratricopeptide (TPR) repeat protein
MRLKQKILQTAPAHDAAQPSFPIRSGNYWVVFGVCVFLVGAIWVVFGQTLGHGFINYDDEEHVYGNPQVIQGLNLKGIEWAFTHSVASNWHPLTVMSHMLDCQIYGLHAGGHHLTNLLLHAATAILLFLVLREMTGKLWRSAFVAAVFAIHPLRVESVAWLSERKDVLSGLFFMLTLGAYVRYFQKGQLDEAAAFYQRALKIKPDDVAALNNLRMAFLKKGLVDEAVVQFRKALDLQPDFALARTNLEHFHQSCSVFGV